MTATTADHPPRGKKGPLDLFLSLFADVRPGEGLGAVLLTLDVLLLMV